MIAIKTCVATFRLQVAFKENLAWIVEKNAPAKTVAFAHLKTAGAHAHQVLSALAAKSSARRIVTVSTAPKSATATTAALAINLLVLVCAPPVLKETGAKLYAMTINTGLVASSDANVNTAATAIQWMALADVR